MFNCLLLIFSALHHTLDKNMLILPFMILLSSNFQLSVSNADILMTKCHTSLQNICALQLMLILIFTLMVTFRNEYEGLLCSESQKYSSFSKY